MEMKLELVPIPVADVDRAKAFYAEQLGFAVDVDVTPAVGVRVVQLTPPGSACSAGRGVDVGEVQDVGGGVRSAGFEDPDGNTLTLQEMAWRTGDAS